MHRNTFVIPKLSKKHEVIENMTKGNKFYIFKNNNEIEVFNILTGKMIEKNYLKFPDYSNYKVFKGSKCGNDEEVIYKQGIYEKTLIMN